MVERVERLAVFLDLREDAGEFGVHVLVMRGGVCGRGGQLVMRDGWHNEEIGVGISWGE